MSAVLEATPAGTQAAMIQAVLGATHPRIALPTIASNFKVTLADLQAILNRHGYPDTTRLRKAAGELRGQAVEEADSQDDTCPTPAVSPTDEKPRMVRVRVDDLHPDPDNLREYVAVPIPASDQNPLRRDEAAGDIEQLADSIREVGLLQPIVARRHERPDGEKVLVVVAGHRRLAAIKRLRWTDVDVIIRAPMKPDHVIAAMLIENGQRRDLDPIEEARGITKLKAQHDLTDMEVARKIGRSQTYVSGRLALLNLTPQQQDEIRTGALGLTGATNLGRLQSGKTRHSAKGHVTVPYFGPTNDIAPRARARCSRLGHSKKLNGTACGACWESVIRADERAHLQTVNATSDDCVTCGHPIDHQESS
ncbi:ParB/RepB/Spo0J family partition protein [Nocardioides sp.]|uniref:ParB/RepB/Spo0J family partition protein n=1 Tax=Nocardioides sp. TaxID=35761 RepID=UPI002B72B083|nr:ParB/RepB/Spo0J family partition protein [Nocardioides sp.]HXH77294.1 ParB/RepB/Spo0J family partition protein [Nocardioides sp.]